MIEHHYAILTSSHKYRDVMEYIGEKNYRYEAHLNRTRFWVPNSDLPEFISLYGGYCDFVPHDQDLMTGQPNWDNFKMSKDLW